MIYKTFALAFIFALVFASDFLVTDQNESFYDLDTEPEQEEGFVRDAVFKLEQYSTCISGGICSNPNKHGDTLFNKLSGKDGLQLVGNFLSPESAQKMKRTSKQWSSVRIYENVSPNKREMAMFRHIDTSEIIWKATEYKPLMHWRSSKIANKEELVSLLRQNKVAKWNGVFAWIADNWKELNSMKESQYAAFLKKLMLATAENVNLAFTSGDYWLSSPMMLAAAINDADSISALIKRGADVNQRGWYRGITAIHVAAENGSTSACRVLLDNSADIDVPGPSEWTPLMRAAYWGNDGVLDLLLQRGARDQIGPALKMAKGSCVRTLKQWQNVQ